VTINISSSESKRRTLARGDVIAASIHLCYTTIPQPARITQVPRPGTTTEAARV
jgi:hypothetical protein